MEMTAKKELSYFRLKLETYLKEHFLKCWETIHSLLHGRMKPSPLTAMPWHKASRILKPRRWQARSCSKACTSPSTIPLCLFWRMSLKKNCLHLSPKDSLQYFFGTRLFRMYFRNMT